MAEKKVAPILPPVLIMCSTCGLILSGRSLDAATAAKADHQHWSHAIDERHRDPSPSIPNKETK